MHDRDQLAESIVLASIDKNGFASVSVNAVYKMVDAMIVESNKAKNVSMRFRIGPVEKQQKIVPAPCEHKHHHTHRGASIMAFVLKDDEQVTATLEFFDKKGKKITPKLDGVPAWDSSDPAAVSVTPAADGLSALIVASGSPEDTATITATADGDLGDGVKEITTTGDVSIIGGDVSTSNMAFGTPTAQP